MATIVSQSAERLLLPLCEQLSSVSTSHPLFQGCCILGSESHSKIIETYFQLLVVGNLGIKLQQNGS